MYVGIIPATSVQTVVCWFDAPLSLFYVLCGTHSIYTVCSIEIHSTLIYKILHKILVHHGA